jgi:hypothetical protein
MSGVGTGGVLGRKVMYEETIEVARNLEMLLSSLSLLSSTAGPPGRSAESVDGPKIGVFVRMKAGRNHSAILLIYL